jgi:3-phenylpropionate/trans-cinnamate dioxygenase ferredoxin reductase subunit
VTGLVVIGASYAGIEAALRAREAGYAEPVRVVTDEAWLPYQRPPLSKDFLLDVVSEQNLILRDGAFFESKRIDLVLDQRVTAIDRQARRVELAGGSWLNFDKLVIAPGSHARRLSVAGAELDGVCTLRSVADALDLKARLGEASELVIIGGGFIGLEVASSAARLGKKVTVVEAAPRLLERAISPVVSKFLLDAHRGAGVDVRLGETVASMIGNAGRIAGVSLRSNARLRADLVLVGVGAIAADELADAAGLRCSNGIVVDEHGRTEAGDIYAAGDCTNHFNRFAGSWTRLESVQNAQDQGRVAGLAIAGHREPYDSVPRFWSDQYDIKLQITGLSVRHDRIAIRDSVEEGTFSVFHYKGGKLIAVDGVNRPGDQMTARRLIAMGMSPSPEQAEDPSFDLKSLLRAAQRADA